MTPFIGAEPLFFPTLGASVQHLIRSAYGVLLLATLISTLPHARRYFISERWGGYAQSSRQVDAIQNAAMMPLVLAVWIVAAGALVLGIWPVLAGGVNLLLCRYFFIQMRWRGVLRGMGAPGFIAYWLGAAVFLLDYTRQYAPGLQGLALLVLQVDFAFIMLSAGTYKYAAGYRHNEGMELGMVNPAWGYWSGFWKEFPPNHWLFRFFNEMAWGLEVLAGVLMLFPPTRFVGATLILFSFVFIATQIRLGFLCEMVIVCTFLFAHPGSIVDTWAVGLLAGTAAAPTPAPAAVNAILAAGLWGYLFLLPLARLGLSSNLHAKRSLPAPWQRALEVYTNFFGLIVWRVFSADITNFFVRIATEPSAGGGRRVVSEWGEGLRYRQVAESITVTSVFTTLKYYPSNSALFRERLLRYARTVPRRPDERLVFEYVSVTKSDSRFMFVPVAEFAVDVETEAVTERVLDEAVSVRAAAARSPIHEGIQPGSYVPLRR